MESMALLYARCILLGPPSPGADTADAAADDDDADDDDADDASYRLTSARKMNVLWAQAGVILRRFHVNAASIEMVV